MIVYMSYLSLRSRNYAPLSNSHCVISTFFKVIVLTNFKFLEASDMFIPEVLLNGINKLDFQNNRKFCWCQQLNLCHLSKKINVLLIKWDKRLGKVYSLKCFVKPTINFQLPDLVTFIEEIHNFIFCVMNASY